MLLLFCSQIDNLFSKFQKPFAFILLMCKNNQYFRNDKANKPQNTMRLHSVTLKKQQT